jgi:hypothetical protein
MSANGITMATLDLYPSETRTLKNVSNHYKSDSSAIRLNLPEHAITDQAANPYVNKFWGKGSNAWKCHVAAK